MDLTTSGKKGFEMSEMRRPSMLLRPEASERACALGWYSQRSTASSTRLRVSSVTYLVPLMTCETVAVETPASRATSLILEVLYGGRGGCSINWLRCSSLIWVLARRFSPRARPPEIGGALGAGDEASRPE